VTGTVISAASPQVVPHRARTPYVFAGHRVRADLQLGVVTPWSAEQPVRYQVVAVLRDADGVEIDQVATWTGCRRVEVRERQLLVNGQPIWIFGVNRHDHHPDRGKALTEQDLRDDLIAMRAHNITAIRTAHYPNHHRFYDLCDELGMYVIDEANIEGHAFNTSLCDDPRYLAAFMERGSRMVHRDRNHPSIIAWSLGNETGYGAHHDALAGWIRRRDPSRPLHYEGAIFHGEQQTSSRDRPPWAHGGRTATDIVCPMYPSIDAIRDYGASGDGDRPLIMCEYSHAMGNSNGSLAEYWEVIADTPGLQGGFIWEWKDHSLRDRDNASRLLHGGDFGDTPHDGNFVADGLLGADGDPHPALSEVAWVYRPVTVTAADNDQGSLRVRLTNRRFFTELTDLEARWEITVDGEHCAAGVWELPPLGPQVSVEHDLPESARVCVAKVSPEAEVVLTVTWHLRDEAWYAPGGHLEAWDQIVLQERRRPQKIASGASVASAPHLLKVEPWIWRAATDNDGFKLLPDLSERLGVGGRALSGWKAAGLPDRAASEVIEIHHVIEAAPDGGQIHRCRYVVTEEMADLPRLGLRCAIAAHFRQITWWGLGAGENYPDRAAGARRGIWTATPDPMPYLVPQEYGRRGETRWVRLCDPMSTGTAQVEVRAIEPAKLSFSVSPYSTEQLQRSANAADLVEEDVLWLHIDLHHRGVGTASCGPDVRPQYRIGPGEYEFAVWIGITEKR
jgi:beta-galactosidase